MSNDYIQQQIFNLQDFLYSCNIKHFQAYELISGLQSGNTPPEKDLWVNILPTLKMLDECRDVVGRIRINSCYRNPEYNERVGGSSQSLHKYFKACDINPLDNCVQDVAKWLNSRIPSDSWGLRVYETFIHIDCRSWLYRNGV